MKTKNHKGFTLIELLVVLAIITLIFSIILASMNNARKRARDSTRVSDFAQFSKALELYYNQFGMYPCGDSSFVVGITFIFADGSGSCPFLDGEDYVGMSPPTPCSGTHSNMLECVAGTETGIYRNGFYPSFHAKDPLNNPNNLYFYTATQDRQSYLLLVKLENNNELMRNDGGLCNNVYEFGTGLGNSNLTLTPVSWLGVSCN